MGTFKKLFEPVFLATAGGVAAVVAAVLAFAPSAVWATALSAVAAAFAIVLTFLIARRQGEESGHLSNTVTSVQGLVTSTNEAVTDIRALQEESRVQQEQLLELQQQSGELLREVAERASAQDYDPSASEEGAEGTEDAQTGEKPDWEDEAIERLRAKHADLDFASLHWKRKTPQPPVPGNHGWFVETPGRTTRWFVRKARGMTVRKAMPRDFLDRLEIEQGVEPRTIALDYQLRQHGLAAWFARTYAGDLFRVSRAYRAPGQPIRTERVDEEG
ncbi:hypothetical protein DEI99_001750 [Curtobacterium sp. MCLR17_036]|uniref:hypothetical protein n=1 Tax=Curtobacterium sp. MCLR17_036 TaxID=2175620 RepID=UPI0011B50E3B|nr:hypothetical protein [Curtobacterium sp. MCLR17_036]WIE65277.1 hypothetical protein DEI99_001750 [Curtobacterium sp. MCLR17_036]